MKKLAKREEQLMHVLWEMKKAFVKEIIEELPDPKPHYNSVSTTIRNLEEKGFVGHESFGKSHRYFARISKETYQKRAIGDILSNYFDNSYKDMVTYFAKEEKISSAELESILKMIKEQK